MTRRRFIADTWTSTTATLTGDQALHLARVLRATPGQIFDVVSNGFLHRAEITHVSEDQIDFTLHEELTSDAALPLHLLLAVFKFDHMEWAIEKATELGIARITPILARRTEKHLAHAALKRAERWRRIALEAAKQSRRADLPLIEDPIALRARLEQPTNSLRVLLSENEHNTTLRQHIDSAIASTESELPNFEFAIGPEGGWTEDELALFEKHHWQSASLGPRILRAETAAISSLAIASALL